MSDQVDFNDVAILECAAALLDSLSIWNSDDAVSHTVLSFNELNIRFAEVARDFVESGYTEDLSHIMVSMVTTQKCYAECCSKNKDEFDKSCSYVVASMHCILEMAIRSYRRALFNDHNEIAGLDV